jgi:hypothetical protein
VQIELSTARRLDDAMHLSSRQHRVQVAYTITEVSLALASAFEDTSSKADDIHVAMNNIFSIFAIDLDSDLQAVYKEGKACGSPHG